MRRDENGVDGAGRHGDGVLVIGKMGGGQYGTRFILDLQLAFADRPILVADPAADFGFHFGRSAAGRPAVVSATGDQSHAGERHCNQAAFQQEKAFLCR